MIIDQFNIFFDDVKAESGITSSAIATMPYTGRADSVYVSFLATGKTTGTITIEIQQSNNDSDFSTIESVTVVKPDADTLLHTFRLPLSVTENHVRLKVSGEVKGLTLFAAITCDHFAPYAKGLYVDKGRVVQ